MAKLKQFKGAAGKMSSEITSNNVMQLKEPSNSLFTQLKNASDVDEVVFGHDLDGSGDLEDSIDASPLFQGTAGIHSSEKAISETAMWYGGPKGKMNTQIEQVSSSTDMTFQKPLVMGNDWQHTGKFTGGAGAPHSMVQDDGTYKHAHKRFGIAPDEEMTDDFAAETNAKEQNTRAVSLPVLSREHTRGSINAVVFSGPDPKGNRDVLGVPRLAADASLLEKRDQSRRIASAQGCRSQAYTEETEFSNAAGLASDELYFANSSDMVRRVKPVTRKAAYSDMTSVDEVVFGHDLEGGDKDGASIVKDAHFAGAAGASSDYIHRTQANARHAPMDVPQLRDQMDNILFGREMQDSDSAIRAEIAFKKSQQGAGGQASTSIGQKGFDRRLEDFSIEDAEPMPTKMTIDNEPRGDLLGPRLKAEPRAYPPGYVGAVGAPRDTLGRIESNAMYVVGSQNENGRSRPRTRNDFDSGDILAVLTGDGNRRVPDVGSNLGGKSAGKLSRSTNDAAVPLLLDDADTDIERKFAARNWSGKNVKATLSGEGYIEHDEVVRDATRKGHLINPITSVDSVGKLNLLKPDENPTTDVDPTVWMDAKSDYEVYLYNKNFGQDAPYGTDARTTPYGAYLHSQHYVTSSQGTENDMEIRLHDAYHKAAAYVSPEETEAGQRRAIFKLASVKSEFEGARTQVRNARGMAKTVPFGVDFGGVNYETSAQAGAHGALERWGGEVDTSSMASRIARRRLERNSPSSTPRDVTGIIVTRDR